MPESYPNGQAATKGKSGPHPSRRERDYNYEQNVLLNLEELFPLGQHIVLPVPAQHLSFCHLAARSAAYREFHYASKSICQFLPF